MTILLLKNFDRAQDVLEYSTDQGIGGVLARKPGDSLDRGFFTEQGGHFYGVFATESGPVAFLDKSQWALTKSGASSELTQLLDGQKRFVLRMEGVPVYDVIYQQPNDIVDNWSDDESISGFFSWLHEGLVNDPKGSFFHTIIFQHNPRVETLRWPRVLHDQPIRERVGHYWIR